MRVSRKELLPGPALAILFTVVAIGLSQTATGLATRSDYRFYPAAMLANSRPISEQIETQYLADFFRTNTTPDQLILPIHDLVTVPYAIFLAGRPLPAQGINLRHSYRQLKPGLSDSEKKETLDVLEREGLWTDESLQTWIDTKYDTIVFQVDLRDRESDLEQRIAERFDRTASLGFRGWNIHLYKRKSNGNDQSTIESGQ